VVNLPYQLDLFENLTQIVLGYFDWRITLSGIHPTFGAICRIIVYLSGKIIPFYINNMKIYLDNCCFNRPFDDQSQLRIRLESEAKLKIQEDIRAGIHELVWSYILDYENSRNPFQERARQISK